MRIEKREADTVQQNQVIGKNRLIFSLLSMGVCVCTDWKPDWMRENFIKIRLQDCPHI